MDKFLIVTGSMILGAHDTVEQYNMVMKVWFERPKLNQGRYYHSSCQLNDTWAYVFGGYQTQNIQNRTWTTGIERMNVFKNTGWEFI